MQQYTELRTNRSNNDARSKDSQRVCYHRNNQPETHRTSDVISNPNELIRHSIQSIVFIR